MMGRIFKAAAGVLAALLLIAGLAWLLSRQMRPSESELQALALVERTPARAGRNGFARLWAINRDVPEGHEAQLLERDVARFNATPHPGMAGGDVDRRSLLEQYPELQANKAGAPAWCRWREDDCLQRVSGDLAGYDALLADHQRLLQRVAALSDYDHFLSPYPPRLDMPIPAYPPLGLPLAAHALAFAQGHTDRALSGVCRDASLGRKIIRSGDNLIGTMVGSAMVNGNATLFADMLAELPVDHPLPAACAAAFAPLDTLAGDACGMMLGEGRYALGSTKSHVEAMRRDKWWTGLMLDPDKTAARMATRFAWYCGDAARQRLAADLPLLDPGPATTPWSLSCASNAAGCILSDIAAPAYEDYVARLQDVAARLRALNVLLWMRGQDGTYDAETLDIVPPALRAGPRAVRLDAEAGHLEVELYERRQGLGESWRVPLPASRIPAAASGD